MISKRLGDESSLKKFQSLAWLSQNQLDQLDALVRRVRVPRRQVIFPEGELAKSVYILLSGVAKLTFLHRGERVLVGLVAPGEIFGVSSLLPAVTRPFRCEAFSDCVVGMVEPEPFVELTLGVTSQQLSRMLDATMGRWWQMLLRYTSFIGLGLRERLASALLELTQKFGVRDARGVILTLKVTHNDLADLVGASRQRTTEQLKEFEHEAALRRDGRRLIVVPERLLEILQSAPPSP